MRFRTPALASLLLILALRIGHADADKPLPPVLQQYLSAVQGAQTLAVTVKVSEDDGSKVGTAYLAFARPNQVKILSREGGDLIATVVSDGKILWQWNKKYYRRRPAPAGVEQISPAVPMGRAAKLARGLFLTQEALGDPAAWSDAGAVKVDGVTTHKLVSSDAETVWLAASTGLPLKLAGHDSGADYTATFSYPSLGKSLPDTTFVASVPPGVTLPPVPDLHNEDKLLSAGSLAPDFSLPGQDAKPVSLSSFQGQVVVLDFWATWCGPCKMTMPHIQKLKDEMGGRGVTFLSVNTADDSDALVSFLKEHPQYTTTFLYDAGKDKRGNKIRDVAGTYKVTGIPTVYLIDAEGRIAASYTGAFEDEETLLRSDLEKLGVH